MKAEAGHYKTEGKSAVLFVSDTGSPSANAAIAAIETTLSDAVDQRTMIESVRKLATLTHEELIALDGLMSDEDRKTAPDGYDQKIKAPQFKVLLSARLREVEHDKTERVRWIERISVAVGFFITNAIILMK